MTIENLHYQKYAPYPSIIYVEDESNPERIKCRKSYAGDDNRDDVIIYMNAYTLRTFFKKL